MNHQPVTLHSTETIVATIQKNASEEVRVRLNEYRGSHFVDLRVFTSFKDGDPERKPTKKGVALNVSKLDELIEALQRAKALNLQVFQQEGGRA
jgi:hypothetical protein